MEMDLPESPDADTIVVDSGVDLVSSESSATSIFDKETPFRDQSHSIFRHRSRKVDIHQKISADDDREYFSEDPMIFKTSFLMRPLRNRALDTPASENTHLKA